jgi:hypothetical protein
MVATSSVAGGAGTIGAHTVTTAATSPHHFDDARNCSDDTAPANNDKLIFANTDVNCAWGLDQNAVVLYALVVEKTYTGRLGLDALKFATSADAETVEDDVAEYRQPSLSLEVDGTQGHVRLGEGVGIASASGPTRINLDLQDRAVDVLIYSADGTSADAGRPAYRIAADNSATDFYIYGATGGVGIGTEPGDASYEVGDIRIGDLVGSAQVYLGRAVTVSGVWEQQSGTHVLRSAGTVSSVVQHGGDLTAEGEFTITAAQVDGGTFRPHNTKSGGTAITALTVGGATGRIATVEARGSRLARTWDLVNLGAAADPTASSVLNYDSDVVTITALNNINGTVNEQT